MVIYFGNEQINLGKEQNSFLTPTLLGEIQVDHTTLWDLFLKIVSQLKNNSSYIGYGRNTGGGLKKKRKLKKKKKAFHTLDQIKKCTMELIFVHH